MNSIVDLYDVTRDLPWNKVEGPEEPLPAPT